MATRKNFGHLRDRARADKRRSARIDRARREAVGEIMAYRLKELRQALGLTQIELARLIGKSQSAVSQMESGTIALSVDVLRSIVQQLGGSLEITAVFDDRRVLIDT